MLFTICIVCHCRVITVCNGLIALLISDQQSEGNSSCGLDSDSSQNKDVEAAESSCTPEQSCTQCDDVGDVVVFDDEDSSWTDLSSDGDGSGCSDLDSSESMKSDSASSCGCRDGKKSKGKRVSQRSHSSSNVENQNGEKLVRIFVVICRPISYRL